MYSESRLMQKYDSYVSMCQEEEIDPNKVLSYPEYCQMYLDILHSEPTEER